MKKLKIEPLLTSRKGAGRINENCPIDLMEYVIPRSPYLKDTAPVCFVPKQIEVSEEIGRTVYDVTGVFEGKIDKSLLQQFKDLILSEQLI